jgi:hypothetical protein
MFFPSSPNSMNQNKKSILSDDLVDFLKSHSTAENGNFLNENSGKPLIDEKPVPIKYDGAPKMAKEPRKTPNIAAENRRDPLVFYDADSAAHNYFDDVKQRTFKYN